MSERQRILSLIDAYVDGELPPERVLEVEEWRERDAVVREHVAFTTAVQQGTRQQVRDASVPSSAFEERLRAALSAEAEREEDELSRRRAQRGARSRPLSWGNILPLAAAAAALITWGALSGQELPEGTAGSQDSALAGSLSPAGDPIGPGGSNLGRGPRTPSASPFAAIDDLIDEFVQYHVDPPEPQFVQADLVEQLTPEVGVPVRPPRLAQFGARWTGGRVLPVRTQQHRAAAWLSYRMGDDRITVYVYDASRFPLRARLEPTVVRDTPVYVGKRRGTSIAAVERQGVGYAVASHLNDQETAELVTASFH